MDKKRMGGGNTELLHSLNSGSRWHRWEPHIHAPGTVLNNQFKGAGAWDKYLSTLEEASPPIRAIGITDYYVTDSYSRLIKAKEQGRLGHCDLIFPNIEMRLAVGTVRGRWANLHLLVSPEDPKHLEEVSRILAQLTFKAYDDTFSCRPDELIRLGRTIATGQPDSEALVRGAEQFKVSFEQLKQVYNDSAWAQRNVLVAVAGGETDGTSGIRDPADATLRQEVEKFADIIFASSSTQRDFWLGRRALTLAQLRTRYRGPKPCLHGSDAHRYETIGTPDQERYSWVKGAVEFDTLRQAIIDPAGRAFVGVEPPFRAAPSQVISCVEIKNADWALTPKLNLNPGLVTIIGARGSGKTALVDAIAAGCDATSNRLNSASFAERAKQYLRNVSVRLEWESGSPTERQFLRTYDDAEQYPRARYLSQKFVEELCSADGATDALIHEIERVIYEAHSPVERDGAVDFEELLTLRVMRFRLAREREEDAIATLSDRIGAEREKKEHINSLKEQVQRKAQVINGYEKDRNKLVSYGSEDRVNRLRELTVASEKVHGYLRYFANQEQSLLALRDETEDVVRNRAPEALRVTRHAFAASGLSEDEWRSFLLKYTGQVDAAIDQKLKAVREYAASWRDDEIPDRSGDNEPILDMDADLSATSLALLQAEINRLKRLINLDTETSNRYAAISRRIADEAAAHHELSIQLSDCEGAESRMKQLNSEREGAYRRVFDAIVAEENVLRELYRPLMQRLEEAKGSLRKLTFSVTRRADLDAWAAEGEALFDLRREGPFKGRGSLEQWAEETLRDAWENGDPDTVASAMEKFRTDRQLELLNLAKVPRSQQADYRAWLRRFAKWLYSTSHIKIRYGIDYEGVDIKKLSPGTRGIVLLLLYLALDDEDDRPLIIDQPEENLDPKSIYDELVELFTAAKNKRQVVMVTHNANLVVNTDADQVIVAFAGAHTPGALPPMTYLSGGLESVSIRKYVCDIMEGGEDAFIERARRLRVRLKK